ncbi:MAG: DUF1801 domain-containing protein [Clostridiales Family XIII bacterium]|jgi:uncharacterized protein YdhG (YjbR/CyaY superfamily)|nr:DUF1801 domain-containing protein [Clostridiales Family XIII bacterium]
MTDAAYTTIDEYIACYDGEVFQILNKTRDTIRVAIPDATEKISWAMPTYYKKRNLIHFAAAKHHLGIYPGAEAMVHFVANGAFDGYKTSKGAVQFPYCKPIPYELIAEVARWCHASVES